MKCSPPGPGRPDAARRRGRTQEEEHREPGESVGRPDVGRRRKPATIWSSSTRGRPMGSHHDSAGGLGSAGPRLPHEGPFAEGARLPRGLGDELLRRRARPRHERHDTQACTIGH
jgi:hypothetical protein